MSNFFSGLLLLSGALASFCPLQAQEFLNPPALLEVNPAFGTLSGNLPLPSLPGRNDFTPKLALIYQPSPFDSNRGLGVGWSFSVSSIQVDNEWGVPHPYYSFNVDKKSRDTWYQLSLDGQPLRYVKQQNGAVEYTTESFDSRVQILRYDQPFTVSIRNSDGVLENRTISSGFELRQADGLRRIYSGDSAVAESYFYLNSGSLPEVQRKYTSRWPLILEIRPGGDAIEYHYALDQGRSYLKDVSFASGRSRYVFHWQTRPSGPISFAAGFRQESRLYYTGLVACLDDEPKFTWLFAYEQMPEPEFKSLPCSIEEPREKETGFWHSVLAFFQDNTEPAVLSNVLHLSSIHRFGEKVGDPQDSTVDREPTLFLNYRNWHKPLDSSAIVHEITNLGSMTGLGFNKNGELFDTNQDGLPDLVVYDKASNTNKVFLNKGFAKGRYAFQEGESFKIRRGTQTLVPLLNEGSQTSRILRADLNGDGWEDLIEIAHDTSWTAFLNRKSQGGAGYEAAASKVKLDANGSLIDLKVDKTYFSNGRGSLIDLNGDGRPDILYPILGTDGKAQFQAYINTTRRASDAITFVARTYKFPFATTNTGLLTQPEFRLIDTNQDGLIDLVKIVALRTGAKGLCVFENWGLAGMSGAFLFREDKPKEGVTCEDQYFLPINELEIEQSLAETFNAMVLMDVDSDGLMDFTRINDKTHEFEYWLGQIGQRGFKEKQSLPLGSDIKISKNKYDTLTLDIDLDGYDEILVWNADTQTLQIMNLNQHGEHKIHGMGLLSRLQYDNGLQQDVDYISYAFLQQKPVPRPWTLVQRLIKRSQTVDLEEYIYGSAAWDPERDSFLGFDQTSVFSPGTAGEDQSTEDARLLVHDFVKGASTLEQRRYLGFYPKLTETFGLSWDTARETKLVQSLKNPGQGGSLVSELYGTMDRTLLQKVAQSYSLLPLNPTGTGSTAQMRPRYFIRHDMQEQTDCGTDACASPRLSRTRYAYDDALFRVQKQVFETNELAAPRGIILPARQQEISFTYDPDSDALGVLSNIRERAVKSLLTDRMFEIQTSEYHPVWALPVQVTTQSFVYDEDKSKLPEQLAGKIGSSESRMAFTRYDGGDGTGFGVVESIADNEGLIESYSYGPASLFRIATQNAKGQIQHECFSARDCTLSNTHGPLQAALRPVLTQTIQGYWVRTTRDALQRPIRIEGAMGEEQTLRYQPGSTEKPFRVETTLRDLRLQKNLEHKLFMYDAEGHLLAEAIDRGTDPAWIRSQQFHSRSGEVLAEAHPYAGAFSFDQLLKEGTTGLKGSQPGIQFSFDGLGRLTQTIAPGAVETTRFEYPAWGRIESKSSDGITRTRQIAARDLQAPEGLIDEEDQLHIYRRNEFGLLREIQSPEDRQPRSFVYDSQGQLLASVLPGVQTRLLERDRRGRIKQAHTLGFDGKEARVVSNQFDELDRLIRVSQNDTLLTEYFYDQMRDPDGILMESPGSLLGTRTYDPQKILDTLDIFYRDGKDRIVQQKTYYLDEADGVVQKSEESRVYQADDQEAQARFGEQLTLDFSYDASGLLHEVRSLMPGQAATLVFSEAQWSASQLLESAQLSNKALLGTWRNDAVHLWNDERTLCSGSCEQPIINDVQKHNGQGYLQARNTGTYTYNKRGELTAFQQQAHQESWSISAAGHFQDWIPSPRSPLLPRAAEGVPLEFDALGRVMAFAGTGISYDAEDRLLQIKGSFGTSNFGYHADGSRSFKRTMAADGQETFVYTPSEMLTLDSEARVNLPLPGGFQAEFNLNQKTITYLAVDQVNTPLARIDAHGTVLESWDRGAYGKLYQHIGTESTASTFASFGGHKEDRETGWINMGQRTYIPALARFITPDPLFLEDPERCLAGSWQECELYTYVANNPVAFDDPTGLMKAAGSAAKSAASKISRATKAMTSTVRRPVAAASRAKGGSSVHITVNVSVNASTPSHGAAPAAKVIVIGEGMGAIKDAAMALRAQGINAKWYQAWGKNFKDGAFDMKKSLNRNERWLRSKMKEGYKIYDIGVDASRARRSPFYALEKSLIAKHNYPTTPMARP